MDESGKFLENPVPYVDVKGVYSDGIERQLKPEYLKCLSSDPAVATVDDKGMIIPANIGECFVTAEYNGVSTVIPVIVQKAEPPAK